MADKETIILEIKYKDGEVVSRKIKENTSALKKEEAATERVQAGFDKMGVVGMAALGALAVAAKKSLDAFIVQEQAVVQMEASLRALGQYTPQLSERFQDLAASLQRTSRYGDEELLPMMSKLITLGGVSADQMERVMKAALDFGVVTGSTATAVDLLAKAAVGYTSSLSRYGIILDEAIPQNEKFEAVLQLIETRMKGMEAQMTQTTGGAIQQMKNAVGDLAEELGSKLAPALTNAATQLTLMSQLGFGGGGGARTGLSGPAMGGGAPTNVATGQTLAQMQNARGIRSIGRPGVPNIPAIGGDMGIQVPGIGTMGQPTGGPPMAEVDEYLKRMEFFEGELANMFTTADDGMSQTASLAQSSAMTIGDSFANAFARMASGSQGAADAIAGAMLGALGQIAMMWGRFHVAQGLAMQFVPGGQVAWGEVAQGAALMALGGTLQGLAGSMGGRGGGATGGYGGGGTPYSSQQSGGQQQSQIIIVLGNGTRTSGGSNIDRALYGAGIDRTQQRVVKEVIRELNNSGQNVANIR